MIGYQDQYPLIPVVAAQGEIQASFPSPGDEFLPGYRFTFKQFLCPGQIDRDGNGGGKRLEGFCFIGDEENGLLIKIVPDESAARLDNLHGGDDHGQFTGQFIQ